MGIGKEVGQIVTTVSNAGADAVITEEETAECKQMWQRLVDDIAEAIASKGE